MKENKSFFDKFSLYIGGNNNDNKEEEKEKSLLINFEEDEINKDNLN